MATGTVYKEQRAASIGTEGMVCIIDNMYQAGVKKVIPSTDTKYVEIFNAASGMRFNIPMGKSKRVVITLEGMSVNTRAALLGQTLTAGGNKPYRNIPKTAVGGVITLTETPIKTDMMCICKHLPDLLDGLPIALKQVTAGPVEGEYTIDGVTGAIAIGGADPDGDYYLDYAQISAAGGYTLESSFAPMSGYHTLGFMAGELHVDMLEYDVDGMSLYYPAVVMMKEPEPTIVMDNMEDIELKCSVIATPRWWWAK